MGSESEDSVFRRLLAERVRRYRELRQEVYSRLTELHEELAAIDRRLASAEELYRDEFGRSVSQEAGGATVSAIELPDLSAAPGPLTGLRWADAIRAVLTDAGTPLHVREIRARLMDGGFQTEARDPLRSIVAIAMRRSGFSRVAPNTYALVPVDTLSANGQSISGGERLA